MGRHLVCSDLHGCGKLWDKIKEFLKPDDTLYILGDSGDRGSASWRVLKESVLHPQVIYIMGNHDEMFVKYITEGKKSRTEDIWFSNGGYETWKDAVHDPEAGDVIEKLLKCPYHQIYVTSTGKSIYLNHSGCISKDPICETWDRRHYLRKESVFEYEYDYIIHGHTPVDVMIEDMSFFNIDHDWEYGHPCYYCDGKKINIDCGSYWEGFTVVLDLDTLEEHVIGKVRKGVAW